MNTDPQTSPHPCNSCPGFSLVEVSIALGIVAFMVLPLVTLAVHAKNAIVDAAAETHASSVAQRIFASLSLSTARSGILLETTHDEIDASRAFESISLNQLASRQGGVFLLIDRSGSIVERAAAATFEAGYPGKNQITSSGCFARIRVLGKKPVLFENDTVIGGPDLFLVEVTVQTPAVAPRPTRRSHSFHAYLKLTDSVVNNTGESG